MKRNVLVVLLVSVLALASCGGGSSGGSVVPVVPVSDNQFAGVWSGAGGNPKDGSQTVTIDLSIDTAGAVSGSIAVPTVEGSVALSGSIDNNGNCSFGYTVAGNTYRITGSFSINEAGDQISGSFGIDMDMVHIGVSLFVLNRTNQ